MFCLVSERPHSLRDLALGGRGWEIPFFLHTSRAQMQQVILQNLVPVHSGFATATSMSPRPVQSPAQLGTGGQPEPGGFRAGDGSSGILAPGGAGVAGAGTQCPCGPPPMGGGKAGLGYGRI